MVKEYFCNWQVHSEQSTSSYSINTLWSFSSYFKLGVLVNVLPEEISNSVHHGSSVAWKHILSLYCEKRQRLQSHVSRLLISSEAKCSFSSAIYSVENVKVSLVELTKDISQECHFHNAERSFKYWVLEEKKKYFNLSLCSSNSNYHSSSLVDPSASLMDGQPSKCWVYKSTGVFLTIFQFSTIT